MSVGPGVADEPDDIYGTDRTDHPRDSDDTSLPRAERAAATRLCSWVDDDFGVQLEQVRRLGEGADTAAEVWHARADDGAEYAVKWTAGGTAAGFCVPAVLARAGVPGVVAPLPTIRGALWSERGARRLALLPWVGTKGALEVAFGREQWAAYGELLARTHALPVPADVAAKLPREEYRHERWSADLSTAAQQLTTIRSNDDELCRATASEWQSATDRIDRLRNRMNRYGEQLRADSQSAPVVLCHGDPHLLNVRLAQQRPWLIDWDDAVLAPREKDLMFVLSGVLYFAPVTTEQQAWFFEGYGAVEINPVRLGYYRCVRAAEDIADPALVVLDADSRHVDERRRALEILRGVLSGTGLLDLALSDPARR